MPSLYDLLGTAQPSQMGVLDPQYDVFERAAATRRAPYRNVPVRPYNATQDFLAASVIPQTPLDYASLMAFGPLGRMASAPVRAGMLGLAGALTSDEAQAGPASKLVGKARSLLAREAPRAELTAAEKAAPYAEPKFPQYADEYPPVGPPGVNPETGKPMRVLTPEAIEFQKERQRIQRDMDKYGFTPYFDPAKRYDVNPADYPTPKNTLDVRPAKPETIRKWLDVIGAPEARQRLDDAVTKGEGLGDSDRWYQMGQVEAEMKRRLGEKQGREAFANIFAAPMAATTTGQPPTANLMLSGYVNYMRNKGLPLPESFVNTPYPIQRGKYGVGPALAQYTKMMDAGGLSALGLENPKRHDFAYDFLGHKFPVMDEQMIGGMTPTGVDPKGKYGLYRQVAEEQAAAAGKDPRYYQEVGWHGFGNKPGQPMIQDMNEMIERTHRLTGRPRQEIFQLYSQGKIPIYGIGGAAAAPSLIDLIRGTDNPNSQ